ncbi:MBL fold metallo-hydrolase [Acuticoccus sediminis]|uniref:MBL fold metallo-hydrolase n=1 Tax=Acuticoccus sediminis TaxID=2184697 RepID=A0A8B2NWI0_9HYPH|nr:MBL fold metallo-hydrolase [Acuticoccus sediminis]RAI01874.1 MBL fold metallo-hydrolase [Acuticoccus sediminis]
MKLTLLGTGTPAPSPRRRSSGYAIEIGDDLLVFDHGPGAHERLLQAGYSAQDVTHVFLTHYHYDHLMDYPRLLLTRWDHGPAGQPELKVHGPPPLQAINDRVMGPQGLFALDIAARVDLPASQAVFRARGGSGARPAPNPDLMEVAPGDVVTGNGWTVRVGPARHAQPFLECVSYRIETEAGSVVYSGDNGGVYDPFVDFARDADVLIHMNHFLSGTENDPEYRRTTGNHIDNAETARRAGVRTLVLTHFLPSLDRPGVKEQMVSEMRPIFPGTIVVGEDLMVVPLASPKAHAAD